MKEYDVKDLGNNDYIVTDKDTKETYNVHLNHYGKHSISYGSGGGGGLGIVTVIIWIALVFVMPVIFFVEKIYTFPSGIVPFILAYLLVVFSFVWTFIPSSRELKFPRLKRIIPKIFPWFLYLLLLFFTIMHFGTPKETSNLMYAYFMPIVGYSLIVYHIKDFNITCDIMIKLDRKKYSMTLIYIIQWLVICIIVLGLMEIAKDFLGDFLMVILCYLYIILVDVKFYILNHTHLLYRLSKLIKKK